MAEESVRVTVNFPVAVWLHVEAMAAEQGVSRTEALRRCISTEVFRREVEAEGAYLVVRRPDGDARVRFPY